MVKIKKSIRILTADDRRAISSCPIKLDYRSELLPESLTDIIYAFYKTGNNWAGGLELDLMCYSKKLKFQSKLDDTNAIRTLWYLGYLLSDRQCKPGHVSVCTRYRLSPKGYRCAKDIAKMIGDDEKEITTDFNSSSDEEIDCPICDGSGIDDTTDEECDNCKGKGTVAKISVRKRRTKIEMQADKDKEIYGSYDSSQKNVSKVKPLTKVQRQEQSNKDHAIIGRMAKIAGSRGLSNVCPICKGGCTLSNGDACETCDGTGEQIKNDTAIIRSTNITTPPAKLLKKFATRSIKVKRK